MTLIAEFCRKTWKDQLSGVIIIGLVLVVAIICLFAQVSVPTFGFKLPQFKLGLALIVVDIVFVGFAFLAFRRPHVRSASTETNDNSAAGVPFDSTSPKIRILVSGDGEGLSFWKCDGAGKLRGWLDVVNFTQSAVKIDRIIGDIIVFNSTVAQVNHLKKETIAPNSASKVYVDAELSPQHIKNIEFQLQQHSHEPSGGLNLTVYLIAAGSEIELHPQLVTCNCRFFNFATKQQG